MKSKYIVDTGPLVALLNRNDRFHAWAIEVMNGVDLPLLTCEPVITEACYLLNRVSPAQGTHGITGLIQKRFIKIDFNLNEQYERVGQLSAKFADTPMDFADACIVRMSEIHSHTTVLTLDQDFEIYRKNKAQVINCLIPEFFSGTSIDSQI